MEAQSPSIQLIWPHVFERTVSTKQVAKHQSLFQWMRFYCRSSVSFCDHIYIYIYAWITVMCVNDHKPSPNHHFLRWYRPWGGCGIVLPTSRWPFMYDFIYPLANSAMENYQSLQINHDKSSINGYLSIANCQSIAGYDSLCSNVFRRIACWSPFSPFARAAVRQVRQGQPFLSQGVTHP